MLVSWWIGKEWKDRDGQESFQIFTHSGFVLKINFIETILEVLYIDMI